MSNIGRPSSPELLVKLKITIPAPTAGRLDLMLIDPIHNKPIYGARAKLTNALYQWWIAREAGTPLSELPAVPSLSELRGAI